MTLQTNVALEKSYNRENLGYVCTISAGASAIGFLSARVITHFTGVAIAGTAGAVCFGTFTLANAVALTFFGMTTPIAALAAMSLYTGKVSPKLLGASFKTFLPGSLLMLGSLPLASYASGLGLSKIALLTLGGSSVIAGVAITGLTVYLVDEVGKAVFRTSNMSAKLITTGIVFMGAATIAPMYGIALKGIQQVVFAALCFYAVKEVSKLI